MHSIKIVHNSSLMLKMFNQGMLNVSNINQGKFKPQISHLTDSTEVVTDIADVLEPMIKSKNLDLQISGIKTEANLKLHSKMAKFGIKIDKEAYS